MTGGYLILERPNPGLVLSTNARFYAIIKPIHHEIKPDSWAWVRIFFFFFFFSLFILSSFTHSFSLIEFPSGMDRYQINLSSALQTSPLQTRSQKSRHPNRFPKAPSPSPFQIIFFTISKHYRIITVLFLVLVFQ